MKKPVRARFFVFVTIFFLCGSCWAEGAVSKRLQGIEFLTGFSHAKLNKVGNLNSIPLIVDFDFNLKPSIQKKGFSVPGLLQFQLEPFISAIYKPDANVELGNAFVIKAGILPETWSFQPYVKAGLGLDYMTQHVKGQSTQFNFFEYVGAGIHYFFNRHTTFTLEARFRHLSNADIKKPNHGVNTFFALTGITYFF
ncbi:MAG: acyloxyacyl hydrolase [Deltaproteobacteria bacterium]